MVFKFVRRIKAFDRRKHVRINLNCLVKYTLQGTGKEAKCLTNLSNLSLGGALLNTFENRLESKSAIELEFQLPTAEKPIVVKAEVMRLLAKRKNSYQAGVRFVEISKQDLDTLQKYISARSK